MCIKISYSSAIPQSKKYTMQQQKLVILHFGAFNNGREFSTRFFDKLLHNITPAMPRVKVAYMATKCVSHNSLSTGNSELRTLPVTVSVSETKLKLENIFRSNGHNLHHMQQSEEN